MKALRITSGILLGAAILGGAWVLWYHSDWIKPPPAAEEPEPVTDVPVHVTKITRATLHKYIECFGVAAPAQIYSGGTPASARVTAPAPGIISELRCFIGQHVDKNAVLFQLDDRVARAEESKAEAALGSARAAEASAQASLHKLKASTRPEQVAIAEIALRKARQAVETAAQNHERNKTLARDELAAAKQVEESAALLAAAREDQVSAEKQLMLLKNTPAPEELGEADAKVAEAAAKVVETEKALAATRQQRTLLTVTAPLAATVIKINASAGESVDVTNPVIELVDLDKLEISASIPSNELPALKRGQPVAVYCAVAKSAAAEKSAEESDDEPAFKCTLTDLGQQVDPKSDLATVRVALPKNSGVQPGQSARLLITIQEHMDVLAVPEECVFRDKTDIQVIAVVENGKSGLQNVKTGLRENGFVEVSGEDLKEGMIVVAAGAYGLPEETKVRIVDEIKIKRSPAGEKK